MFYTGFKFQDLSSYFMGVYENMTGYLKHEDEKKIQIDKEG